MIKLPGTYGQISRQLRGQVVAFDEGDVAGVRQGGRQMERNPWLDPFTIAARMGVGVGGRGGTHKEADTHVGWRRRQLRLGRMAREFESLPPAVQWVARGIGEAPHDHEGEEPCCDSCATGGGCESGHDHDYGVPEWKAAGSCCESCYNGGGCTGSVGGCGGCGGSTGTVGCGC